MPDRERPQKAWKDPQLVVCDRERWCIEWLCRSMPPAPTQLPSGCNLCMYVLCVFVHYSATGTRRRSPAARNHLLQVTRHAWAGAHTATGGGGGHPQPPTKNFAPTIPTAGRQIPHQTHQNLVNGYAARITEAART